jgi:hypothetical protein
MSDTPKAPIHDLMDSSVKAMIRQLSEPGCDPRYFQAAFDFLVKMKVDPEINHKALNQIEQALTKGAQKPDSTPRTTEDPLTHDDPTAV